MACLCSITISIVTGLIAEVLLILFFVFDAAFQQLIFGVQVVIQLIFGSGPIDVVCDGSPAMNSFITKSKQISVGKYI